VILSIAVADSAIHMPFAASPRSHRHTQQTGLGQALYLAEIAAVCRLRRDSAFA
jgi:hypothetical protein